MVQNNFTLNWTQLGILFSNFTFLIVHFEFEIRRGFQLLFLYYPSFKHILNQGGKKVIIIGLGPQLEVLTLLMSLLLPIKPLMSVTLLLLLCLHLQRMGFTHIKFL